MLKRHITTTPVPHPEIAESEDLSPPLEPAKNVRRVAEIQKQLKILREELPSTWSRA